MLLSDFIKELKHKSLWLNIIDEKPFDENTVFVDTLGVLLNYVPYLNTYSKYEVSRVVPVLTTYDKKSSLYIYIYEV